MAIRQSPTTVMDFEDRDGVEDYDIDRFYESLGSGNYTESEIAILQRAFDIVFGASLGEEEGEEAFNRREGVVGVAEAVVQVPERAVLGREEAAVAGEVGPPAVLIIPNEADRETPSPLPVRSGSHDTLDEVRADLFEARPVFSLFSPIRSNSAAVVQSGDDIDEGKCPEEEDRVNTGVSRSTITQMEI